MVHYNYEEVLSFWFDELQPSEWFNSTERLDNKIRVLFERILVAAKKGELFYWRTSIRGRLAEIIVLDQFSRNIYRNDSRAYEGDSIALVLAQEAVMMKEKEELSIEEKSFIYMPFMHSESLFIQENYSMVYFKESGLEKRYFYAKEHYETIKRFGRFPYRNNVLDRISTLEEIEYLSNL